MGRGANDLPDQGRHVRKLLPFLWITLVYFGVVLAEGHDPSPPAFTVARILFETRHTIVHLLTFGIQAWLIARAVGLPGKPSWRALGWLIALGVVLGSGIEVLQASRRPDYELWGGLWDIITDGAGAAGGWFIITRRAAAAANPDRPGKIEGSQKPERTHKFQ